MEETQQIQEQKPRRPQLLTILCILTFIGSGISAFGFFIVSVDFETSIKLLKAVYADMPETAIILQAPHDFFIISFFLSAFSILGAVFMWNLRKLGFHIYTSAQLIYLVVPLLYFGGDSNPMFNILFTALFVYLYARNLPQMK
jgi:hypothetical protein